MLNAAEAAMDQAAEDDSERARNRAKLYAPPHGVDKGRRRGRPARGGGLDWAGAQALMAQVAAEDAKVRGR